MTTEAGSEDELRNINARIGEAEKRHAEEDVEFLGGVLHDDLVFRRADGRLVSKRDYLDAVPNRTYERLEAEIVRIHETEASAVVTLLVDAVVRTQDGGTLAGRFRNVRVFVRDGGGWRCRIWVNTPEE